MEDFLFLDSLFSDDEKLVRTTFRKFVEAEVMPCITQAFEDAQFPSHLVKHLAELGALGMTLPKKYGGTEANSLSYGLMCQELERGDSALRSFVSVQNSLCMFPIFRFGSEAQKKRFLPKMAKGELIGCFGLTEPNSGSDPASMSMTATKIKNGYRLSGSKTWITNAAISDLAVVWAKTEDGIRGFVVEKGLKGFSTTETKHKLSMRASSTGELLFDDCEVSEQALLPGTGEGLAYALKCLTEARYGIAWGATGAGMACYDIALRYTQEREQFAKPLAANQLVQKDLVNMLSSLVRNQLLNIQLGRLKDQGKINFAQVSMGKMTSSRDALEVARIARNLLGANGISLEYHVIRHMANLETVFTYEGTDNIHHLIIGKHITGLEAF
ncbi:MAG: acyl-CoA dehydrogenase family protein [Deltaproteobacteria bacterium]|nr:acyl-CoA dehydrogenase family protein [Deltaproteobacteria bacterium]